MIVHIDRAVLTTLAEHARGEFPRECCGVLFGRREGDRFEVRRVEAAANITEGDPGRSFQVDWQALFRAVRVSRAGSDTLLGFYHSHPDGSDRPSPRDAAEAWEDHLYLIVPIQDGVARRPTAWFLRTSGAAFTRVDVTEETG